MTIDEIIELLVEVRVDLTILKKSITSKEIKEKLKMALNGIDIVGCELAQNVNIFFFSSQLCRLFFYMGTD
ncbi:MAG: hypothetical protein ACFFD7_14785 [Candidatus Thorarchaeota archaeon]